MPARDCDIFLLRQIAQCLDSGIGTSLLQVIIMILGSHEVKDSSDNPHFRIEMLEAIQQRSDRISRTLGIDNQHDGNIQCGSHLGTASLHAVVTVEQAHHAFGYGNISRKSISAIHLFYMLFRHHKTIQIDRRTSGSHLMMTGVNIIRPALKWLYNETFASQCPQ